MPNFEFRGKTYEVDKHGFLINTDKWDRDFAAGMAPMAGIAGGLNEDHWRVISFIRSTFSATGRCPMAFEIGRRCSLKLADLKKLFPTGYMRGACHLAGLTYRQEGVGANLPPARRLTPMSMPIEERTYTVDIRGFLMDSSAWDEDYAVFKAREMKMPELNEMHWQIIYFLREQFLKTDRVPTLYEACESVNIDLEDLGALFPDGYHRGVVKIAGLRYGAD